MPMRALIVRYAPTFTAQPALQAHIAGRNPAESSVPRKGVPEFLPLPGVGPQETAAARRWLEHVRANPKRGARGHEAVDVFIGGPPPMSAPDAWSIDKLKRWRDTAMETFRRVMPAESMFLDGAMHLGETSPHMQFMFVPKIDGRNSWRHTQAHMAEELLPGAGKLRRGPQLSKMHDAMHLVFGEPFGLLRGEVGSKSKHLPPDREKGYILRVDNAQRDVADAARKREDAERRAEEADRDAKRRVEEADREARRRVEDADRRANERIEQDNLLAEARADRRAQVAERRAERRVKVFQRRAMLARQMAERDAQKSDSLARENAEWAGAVEERCMRLIRQGQDEEREHELKEMAAEREKFKREAAERDAEKRRELEAKHRTEKPENELVGR